MADLSGADGALNYKGIINMETLNTPLSGSLQYLTDGEGNNLPIRVGTNLLELNGLTITPSTGTLTIADGKILTLSNELEFTGTDGSSVDFGSGGTVAYTANKLSVFASTSSAQLASVISDPTGSGALVFANTPTFVTPVLGAATGTSVTLSSATSSLFSSTFTGATHSTAFDGVRLYNTTAAASSQQQYSPAIHFQGQGWKTNATAASQAVDWLQYVVPVQAAANPSSYLTMASSINGGSYTERHKFGSDGSALLGTIFSVGGGVGNGTFQFVASGAVFTQKLIITFSSGNTNSTSPALALGGNWHNNLHGNDSGVVGTGYLGFSSVNGTEGFRLNANGNVLIGTTTDGLTAAGSLAIAKDLAHRGAKVGFYNTAPITQQTGVAVDTSAIHAALVNLGLITS